MRSSSLSRIFPAAAPGSTTWKWPLTSVAYSLPSATTGEPLPTVPRSSSQRRSPVAASSANRFAELSITNSVPACSVGEGKPASIGARHFSWVAVRSPLPWPLKATTRPSSCESTFSSACPA